MVLKETIERQWTLNDNDKKYYSVDFVAESKVFQVVLLWFLCCFMHTIL